MAILYSYPKTLELLPADMLIGTSTIKVAGKKKNITKNFTLELLKNFILDGNVGVQWGAITGTLSNQTDLQAALNAKQNNITLTTTGSTGPATLVGSALNVPDYSTGINVPTLNQVLTVGNTSLLDLKAGNLYSYDNLNAGYGIVQFYDGGVSLKAAITNNILFYNDATGTVKFSNGTYLPTLNFAGVGNNVYTFQNANGTLAFTSDIPSLTGYVPYTGATQSIDLGTFNLTANSIIKQGGTSTQFLMANGTVTIGNGGVYSYEIHVSQVDGNDITGTGALLNPVATITKALTLITGQRKTIVIHPGNYTESPSITTQYTVLTTYEVIGGNTLITGTISTNTGCTISGLKMTNLSITAPTGQGNVNILNCDVSGTLTKSSTGDYTLIRFTDIGTTNITSSAGLIAIFGGNPNFITINNAGARVIVKNAVTVAPMLIAGNANFVDCIIIATTGTSNAITTSAGTIVTLANSQIVVPTFNNVARVSLSGFYSIFNTVFDKSNSFLISLSGTGGSTNSIDYFQFINADKFIKQGGTSLEYLMADGSVSLGSAGTVTSVAALTLGITGTDLSSSVATGTTTPVITLNVPTASAANRGALSSTDWSTFNAKQDTLGFTPVPNTRELTINGTTYDLSANRSWTITASGKSINVVSVNTNAGSASSTDYVYLASGTINVTLPTAVGNQNLYTIKNVGTGTITIDTTSSQTIDGSLTAPIKVQYLSLTLISDGANWNII